MEMLRRTFLIHGSTGRASEKGGVQAHLVGKGARTWTVALSEGGFPVFPWPRAMGRHSDQRCHGRVTAEWGTQRPPNALGGHQQERRAASPALQASLPCA